MVVVTFEDELELNAVKDGLNRLIQAESFRLARLATIRRQLDDDRQLEDNTFATDTVRAAIRHAMRAQLALAAAVEPSPSVTMAAGIDATWAPGEIVEAFGR